jgi:hypothetical protein
MQVPFPWYWILLWDILLYILNVGFSNSVYYEMQFPQQYTLFIPSILSLHIIRTVPIRSKKVSLFVLKNYTYVDRWFYLSIPPTRLYLVICRRFSNLLVRQPLYKICVYLKLKVLYTGGEDFSVPLLPWSSDFLRSLSMPAFKSPQKPVSRPLPRPRTVRRAAAAEEALLA